MIRVRIDSLGLDLRRIADPQLETGSLHSYPHARSSLLPQPIRNVPRAAEDAGHLRLGVNQELGPAHSTNIFSVPGPT
jgi:hypothetical protein